MQSLVDVTTAEDPDVLARSWVPANSPYLGKITADEGHNGMYPTLYNGQQVFWIGNTSRDQYLGVFFGLAVAYDFAADAGVRKQAAALVSRLLDNLLLHGWSVPMPGGTPPASTTFLGRPDEQLTMLQIGRHVNPGNGFAREPLIQVGPHGYVVVSRCRAWRTFESFIKLPLHGCYLSATQCGGDEIF